MISFILTATICSRGRSFGDWKKYGTGKLLAFQIGKTPDKLMEIPMVQADVTTKTEFLEGNCFAAMGKTLCTTVFGMG